MDFTESEFNEGVRFIWNYVPSSRQLLKQNMIPFGVFASPYFIRETPINKRMGAPLKCAKCDFIASPYSALDPYQTRTWTCCNCSHKNPLSNQLLNYLQQGGQLLEFDPTSTVFEYVIDSQKKHRRTVIFTLDTSVTTNELEEMKNGLLGHFDKITEDINVGLITFGKHIKLYNLISPFRQEIVLDGEKTYTDQQIYNLLSLRETLPGSAPTANHKFVQPFATCRARIEKIIKRLRIDSFDIITKKEKKRNLRATGNAIFVSHLVASSFSNQGTKIALFLGGACTYGPGSIISPELVENFRSHEDLEKDADARSKFNAAKKFYESMIDQFVKMNVTIDFFAFCLDQYGLGEMSNLIQHTGGLVINHEEFKDVEYVTSIERYFSMVFGENTIWSGKVKAFCTGEMGLHGVLGNLKIVNKVKELENLDNLIDQAGGNEFYLGNCSVNGSYLFLFQQKDPNMVVSQKPCYFQFQSSYFNNEGDMILRVTTLSRNFCQDQTLIQQTIDQEAAIACIARLSSYKTLSLETSDIVYWLNTILIKFLLNCETFLKNFIKRVFNQ